MSGFEELGLLQELVQAVTDLDWYLPTPIQQEAIPLILGGGDVMAAAETGSGKTGAFCLPMLQVTWENLNRRLTKKSAQKCIVNRDDSNPNCKSSADGRLCQCHNPTAWSGARCTFGVRQGKWYYEAEVQESGGIIRVGWSTLDGGLELGKDQWGFGFGGTGKKSLGGNFEDYGEPFDKGDVIGCAIDFAGSGSVSFYKNGKDLGVAYSRIPDCGRFNYHPAICIKNSQVRLAFSHVLYLPPGYKPMDEAAGPEQDEIAAEFQRRMGGRKVGPTCIVIEPTLELAQQVVEETKKFIKYLQNPVLKMASIVGQRDRREILTELRGGADIVVSTPGKLEAFIDSGELNLSNTKFVILDEADRFASENFNLVVKIHDRANQHTTSGKVQLCMFSATLHSPEIKQLAEKVCPLAMWVDLKGKEYVPETVHHAVVHVDPAEEKIDIARSEYKSDGVHYEDKLQHDIWKSEAVKHLKPQCVLELIDTYQMDQALIFCRTRIDCDLMAEYFTMKGGKKKSGKSEKGKENPYSNSVLHSGFSPKQRQENLELFKDGFVRFLICTDVAARGIDITGLPFVINVTLPDKPDDYIHRIGRTGRADRMGLAISIVARCKEKVWYHTCGNRGGQGCYNTDIATVQRNGQLGGGCCIWYDEPDLSLQIERRLGKPFDVLDKKNGYKYNRAEEEGGAVLYGRSREEAQRVTMQLDPSCFKIAELDRKVQGVFLDNKAKLASMMRLLQ